MWKGPEEDPGGGSSQELSDLKDQFEQQQVLISQLKEMLRKNEQSNVTQEKVDEYMNTLSRRAKKQKREETVTTVAIPASQKINLLRQQVEENKLRLAERGKSQKGIEEMVTQLKAQLDDSQSLITQNLNISPENKTEYSENSSAQELYLVLLTKEKKVSDLLAKVHKLESNVLDLQENLKEKDSVIDARTKAITLMTENLSRKNKTSLDALDETKEQMRKMQENFVSLEAEMKARQVKLLDDLRQKNYEIAELEERNSSSEAKLRDFEETLNQKEDSEEVTKLKKQLDESNKNMIKVKAQQKSKVKELTKKLEDFKKMSDVNAEVVRLEGENGRLNQRLVELEEEKGSLQLKLVEVDSTKGSEGAELKSELEDKLQNLEQQLRERDQVISFLETEISRSKSELDTLTEQLNSQVTSDLTTIQFEEQLERIENENRRLIGEAQALTQEKQHLLETTENLQKEKQEISIKLEQYIQENIELIDKLEKLSAEKVSSAESIEMVENLTQQEKLELEAYQKSLDLMAGNLKSSEENLPQVDLNESVNELTEETSELLQKIELFTVERREVMEKMEQLKQENTALTLKIKEIENTRDVLEETYEQLQSEKEAVEVENLSLKERIEKKEDPQEDTSVEKDSRDQDEKLIRLQSVLEDKSKELEDLQRILEQRNQEEFSKSVQLEGELAKVRNQFEEKFKENQVDSTRIVYLEEELTKVRNELEERMQDLQDLDELKRKLQQKSLETNQLNNTIIDLNRSLADLENDNKSLQMRITQLEEHKLSLSEQIDKNLEELEAVSNTKDNEITKLMKERDNTENVIADLQRTIGEKDENFHKITSDLKNKYIALQKQLEANSSSFENITSPLEARIQDLNTKNKEQLEKMKKIAANLKKKNQAYSDLEEKFKESQQQIQDLESELSRLKRNLEEKQSVEERNVELQNVILELKKSEQINEVSLQQELLLTKENLGSVENSLQSKIQELEMMLETREAELWQARERVGKLEEGISFVEERRLSLERRAFDLGAQLEEKVSTCEEISKSEDLLERRLEALIAHDEAIERKLEEAMSENQDLGKQNRELREKNDKLKVKLDGFKEKIRSLEGEEKILEDVEGQNERLKQQIHTLETQLKNLQNEYEIIVEESKSEFDRVNSDWQIQFEGLLKEKTELMIQCEKFEEEIKDIAEKEVGFNYELIEYKTKLEQSEAEIGRYEEEIQLLKTNTNEVEHLKQTILEKDETLRSYEERIIKNYEDQIQRLSEEKEKLEHLKQTVVEKEETIQKYEERLALNQQTIQTLSETITNKEQELKREKKEPEARTLASFFDDVPQTSTEPEIMPTINWSTQASNDPFDFVEANEAPKVANTLQELQEKIRTLEFLLHTAEKDKEEALLQCQQLTSELTRLIYEKQLPAVEAQIIQEENIRDASKQLQQLEFEETRDPTVAEEPCQAKEAYLCFPEKTALESQILSESDIVEGAETKRELREIEFEKTQPARSSTEPVNEEACTSKEAYLCFGENDDGWGWGPDEAKLEEEHAQKSENFDNLRERIRCLEAERESHLEEIKQLQVKSGKLVKKLKEFKSKNEELSQQRKKSDSDFFNLDDAIQEELKLQIQQVEKRLKETLSDLEKEKHEKGAILKKIDVLTSANEKMVEMKEKQDIEMLGWQQNCRELNAKLEQMEWGDDGFSPKHGSPQKVAPSEGDNPLQKRVDELNETIKDLTLDNEELQSLLEEQRRLKKETEKSVIQLDNQQEREVFQNQLKISVEEKKQLQDEVNELIKKNTQLSEKLQDLEKQNQNLEDLRRSQNLAIEELTQTLSKTEEDRHVIWQHLQDKSLEVETLSTQSSTEEERLQLLKDLEEKNTQISDLRTKVELQIALEEEKEILFKELKDKNIQINSLQESFETQLSSLKQDLTFQIEKAETLLEENKKLTQTVGEKETEIERLSASMNQESFDTQLSSLTLNLDSETQKKETLLEENKTLSQTVAEKETEVERLSAAMDQMTQEWNLRIDQRGSDVAESWKLHLESMQTEFAQVEQILRKEIYELEEKTNALVNENNELRKNVDAEIRNEVDRVAALQQQITDRQQCIGELTRNLQEKQIEVESLEERLRQKEEELRNCLMKLQELEERTSVMEGNQREIEELKSQLEEKERIVAAFNQQMQEVKNLQAYELESVDRLVEQHKREMQELKLQSEEKDRIVATLTQQVQEVQNLKAYEHENIENLQQTLLESQEMNRSVQEENRLELLNLKQALEEKSYALESLNQESTEQALKIDNFKRELDENEELIETKKSELERRTLEVAEATLLIEDKNEECLALQKQIEEHGVLIEDERKQLGELRAIIEGQVLKIEELKTELFQKSNDYDSLIAELDLSSTVKEQHKEEDLSEPVSRAELDLAQYMLYQRDVRCEELTVELTQLLEERDTLQLRLSNVLREKEELGRHRKEEVTSTEEVVQDTLTTKLSELKSVGYKRDKNILDEREKRRLQLSIMQQHREEASKLPPEAAARLVDASYTLSRDVQSPSKVLLNWLWGKSTPRVNDV